MLSTSLQRSTEHLRPVWRLVDAGFGCGTVNIWDFGKNKMKVVIFLFFLGGNNSDLWRPLHWPAVESLPCLRHICCQTDRSWKGKWQKSKYEHKGTFFFLALVQHLLGLYVCYVHIGTAEAGSSLHTNGTDGVQPGSRAEEDEAHPRWDHYRSTEQQHSSAGYSL